MSTTTTPEPIPLTPPQAPVMPSIETAPSALVDEGPVLPRIVMVVGLALFLLGVVVVIATRVVGTPRLIPEGAAYLLAAAGLVLLLYHAAVERDQEFRRIYGGAAVFALLAGVVFSLVPGPFEGSTASTKVGYYLLPWGVAAGFVGLLFTLAASRHETEEFYEKAAAWLLLVFGVGLTVGSVVAGVVEPDFIAGPGIVLALLGVGFICGYFSRVETFDGPGYTTAFGLGVLGAATVLYAVARAVFPTVLYDGPSALRGTDQSYALWPVIGRGLLIAAFAAVAVAGAAIKSLAGWLRVAMVVLGLAAAGAFIAGTVGSQLNIPPKPFLIPGGVSLMAIGLLFLGISLAVCSDSQFVTLTRRELSAYFLSPIGILVLLGMAIGQWLSYAIFVGILMEGEPVDEPIVRLYGMMILNVFLFTLQVPILTMRLLAEEKRTGSLEVLLTAPVTEAAIVGSKFLGTLIFFLICWLPVGLFLIALRVEGTQAFDYRPLLGYYLCLAGQGAMFIAMGMFFSSLTKNQIVAAMFSFVVLVMLLFFAFLRQNPILMALPDPVLAIVSRLSFYHMWREALAGQLPVRDLLMEGSLAVFGLYITTKVLEVRKWS